MSKVTISWTDGHGTKVSREVNMTLDIRDFEGLAGYPWLLLAANPQLSIPDIMRFLELKGNEGLEAAQRSASWFQRRRWMFSRTAVPGTRPNADGKDAQAFAIMREHPKLPARRLSKLLKERGIQRGKDWVIKNRVARAV